MFLSKDKEKVMEHLNASKNRASLPAEMRYVRFVWGLQNEESEFSELYAIKGNRDGFIFMKRSTVLFFNWVSAYLLSNFNFLMGPHVTCSILKILKEIFAEEVLRKEFHHLSGKRHIIVLF